VRLSGSFFHGFLARFVIALVAVGLLTAAGFVGVNLAIDQKLDQAKRVKFDAAAPPPPEGANFLVIGSDSREGVDTELEEEAFGDPNDPGASGRRSDTMMVIHVEPDQKRSFVMSFPRDLMVEIPGQGEGLEQINSAYSIGGPNLVAETLQQNFQIPIHHFVEVGLLAFVDIVDAIGSVPVHLDGYTVDVCTGFQNGVYGPGVYDLNGEQALQYVRARHMLQYNHETGEYDVLDAQADIDRIARQQQFIRDLAAIAVAKGLNNPLTANRVADGVLDHLVIDDKFSREDMFGLITAFRNVDPTDESNFPMITIPWRPWDPDPNRLVVDQPLAQPYLDQLKTFGEDADPADDGPAPPDVVVRVLNASGEDGAAEEASNDLAAEGFQTAGFGNAEPIPTTQILYAPGLETSAQLVQSYLGGVGQVIEDSSIVDADVVVVIGEDFGGVSKPSGGAGTALGPVQLASAVRPSGEKPVVPEVPPPPSEECPVE
jgi:LCP family protein required for cell wall assembly